MGVCRGTDVVRGMGPGLPTADNRRGERAGGGGPDRGAPGESEGRALEEHCPGGRRGGGGGGESRRRGVGGEFDPGCRFGPGSNQAPEVSDLSHLLGVM
jgi:hypothetical protein